MNGPVTNVLNKTIGRIPINFHLFEQSLHSNQNIWEHQKNLPGNDLDLDAIIGILKFLETAIPTLIPIDVFNITGSLLPPTQLSGSSVCQMLFPNENLVLFSGFPDEIEETASLYIAPKSVSCAGTI